MESRGSPIRDVARRIFRANLPRPRPEPLLMATLDDLSIDDNLSQLDRLVQYSTSNIALQRLVHTKMIAETARLVGYDDTVKSIIPILHTLCTDSESVIRQHLAWQIRELAEVFTDVSIGENKNNSPIYCLTTGTLLPILATLLADRQIEVRSAASEALVGTACIMDPADLGQHILTITLRLAHDFDETELRITAAGLLNDLAEILGEDLCRQFVMVDMVSLGEDPSHRVRKATALSLYKIAQTVGRPLSEVSSIHLTEVALRLATDSNKLVHSSALQHLGPFISTLKGNNVYINEKLVSLFITTAGDDVLAIINENYFTTFHKVAQVLTAEQVEQDLLEHMETLLLDVDKVRTCMVQHLHVVFSIISIERRVEMLALLLRVLENSNQFNWRLRDAFSAQLPRLIPLFPALTIFNSVLPLTVTLLEDPVFCVRATTSSAISPLHASLSDKQRESLVRWVCDLSTHSNSSSRQMFIYVVQRLPDTMTKEDFSPTFSEPLVLLANDKVVDVRITLVQSLGNRMYPQWFAELPDIHTVSTILRVDENVYVRGAMLRDPIVLNRTGT